MIFKFMLSHGKIRLLFNLLKKMESKSQLKDLKR